MRDFHLGVRDRLRGAVQLLGLGCLLILYTARVAAADSCQGLVIDSVLLSGCQNTKCEQQQYYTKFIRLTDIEVKKTLYSKALIESIVKRFIKTGFFREVKVRCQRRDGHARVTFDVVGNSFIRKVTIKGDYHFFKSEIQKSIFLRPGKVFNYPGKEAALALERQKGTLLRKYVREGFYDTKLRYEVKRIQQYQLELIVTIDKGKKLKIAKVNVRFDKEKPEFEPRKLMRVMKLSEGATYTGRKRQQARKNLLKHFRIHGYAGVRVEIKWILARRQLDVEISTQNARRYEIVFRGNRSVDSEVLRALLPFGESGVFTETEAGFGVDAIRRHYETKGFLFADVRLSVRKNRIEYDIVENRRVEVRHIRFVGNRRLTREKLLGVMQTKEWDFFDDGGFLQVEQVMQDLARLRQLYQQQGFHRFKFKLTGGKILSRKLTNRRDGPCLIVFGRERDRHCTRFIYTYTYRERGFQIVLGEDATALDLRIELEEGTQSTVSAISVVGKREIKTAEITKKLPIGAGKPISYSLLLETYNRVVSLYQSKGYHQVKVEMLCRAPKMPEQKCNPKNTTAVKVMLRIKVTEGPRLQLGEIFLHGNLSTVDNILMRDFPKPGAPFDQQKIEEGKKKLRDLGIFRQVQTEYIGIDETPPRKRVAMVISVEEDSSQFLEFSIGFQTFNRTSNAQFGNLKFPAGLSSSFTQGVTHTDETIHGFGKQLNLDIPDLLIVGRVEYINKNLFGRAWELRIPLELGMSMTSEIPRLASGKVTWINTRFFDTDLNLRVTALTTYDRASEVFDQLVIGGEVELSKELYRGLVLSVLVEVQGIKIRKPTQKEYQGFQPQTSLTPTLTFNRLDNPIHPTSGYWLSGSVSYLLANGDNFAKWSLEAKFVFSLRKKYIFAFYFRYADGKSFSSKLLPITERFKLGGGRNVRGFGDDAIGQYSSTGRLINPDPDRIGGDTVLNGSFEFRLPIVQKIGIWAAVFADFGGLADSLAKYTRSSIRGSVGFGLRYLVGNQIPIRFDYAFILDRRCLSVTAEPLGAVTWSCNRREPVGNYHIQILYSF
ncbi:MAG: BamA/TamA family outer membrane protein [Myxococcales bacterium]|nr:BamA/TamA family outer membrane protein [Myxococcales bacterium]